MHIGTAIGFWQRALRVLLACCCLFYAAMVQAEKINVCISADDFMPYVGWHNSDGKNLSAPEGITIDAIATIFQKLKLDYRIVPIVWSRLSATSSYRDCDVIWDIAVGTASGREFLLSRPLYKTPISVIYNRSLLADADLQRMQLADLFKKRRRICGVRGFDYREINSLVNVKVASTKQALDVLRRARCTLFFLGTPILEYGHKNGIYRLDNNIGFVDLGGDYVTVYYAAVTKRDAKARALLRDINNMVAKLQRNGDWDGIFARYGVPSYLNLQKNTAPNAPLGLGAVGDD